MNLQSNGSERNATERLTVLRKPSGGNNQLLNLFNGRSAPLLDIRSSTHGMGPYIMLKPCSHVMSKFYGNKFALSRAKWKRSKKNANAMCVCTVEAVSQDDDHFKLHGKRK